MIDPESKAREICDKLAQEGEERFVSRGYTYYDDAIKLITTALREYGEAEFKRGRDQERESVIQYGKEQRFKADAEGYRRGIEDAAKLVDDGYGLGNEIRALAYREGK